MKKTFLSAAAFVLMFALTARAQVEATGDVEQTGTCQVGGNVGNGLDNTTHFGGCSYYGKDLGIEMYDLFRVDIQCGVKTRTPLGVFKKAECQKNPASYPACK